MEEKPIVGKEYLNKIEGNVFTYDYKALRHGALAALKMLKKQGFIELDDCIEDMIKEIQSESLTPLNEIDPTKNPKEWVDRYEDEFVNHILSERVKEVFRWAIGKRLISLKEAFRSIFSDEKISSLKMKYFAEKEQDSNQEDLSEKHGDYRTKIN